MSKSTRGPIASPSGFTLVELMMAMAISLLAMLAIVAAYLGQNRSFVTQQHVVDAQQTARAAMFMLTDDIRMAGSNGGNLSAGRLPFTQAQANNFTFQWQLPGQAVPQRVTYAFCNPNGGANDSLCRTIADNNGNIINTETIASNIEALEFFYTTGQGSVPSTVTPTDSNQVTAVQVSLLARAAGSDPNFHDANTYTPASGSANWSGNWPAGIANPPNDNFHRRLVIENVVCRNLVN